MIAALYVDPRGPYANALGVDVWDAARDATDYEGPWAVVAHPPCGAWGKLRHRHAQRDAACAPIAVAQVRRWGGVLEQPAGSKLWLAVGLPTPGDPPDAWGGYAVEVAQVEWGHVARKRTWLYLVGVPREALEAPPFPGRHPTHWVSGTRNPARPAYDAPPPGIKICSAEQRNRTPPLFAAYLARLAEAAQAARKL